jgi:anaerobic selenocysteine-containing dehydrogenase
MRLAQEPAQDRKSFCRICFGLCGLSVRVGADGHVIDVRGDRDHPLSHGYACSKGIASGELHNSPDRLLHPLKRLDDGRYVRIGIEQALDEIAERLAVSVASGGPNSHAIYQGMGGSLNAGVRGVFRGWLKAIGSTSYFSSMTIDQSAKWVSAERLGSWAAGPTRWDDADVWLAFGFNPLVSASGALSGFNNYNPVRRMKDAKARGMKIIVIDPRETETARQADIFLQPRPGEDATIAAGFLHLILAQDAEDKEFCTQFVDGLDALRSAVQPFNPAYVAERAGIGEADLRTAVTMFLDARKGGAFTGTGPNMSRHSNLSQHLIDSINVVCGRFPREGDLIGNPGVLGARRPAHAQVAPPCRSFEHGRISRVGGRGMLFGQMMTGALADEILVPGPDRISSLIVVGGNLASALPDQAKAVRALSALDLLVVIDPLMNATAKLAHYVLPPRLMFERPDLTLAHSERNYFPAPFAQYAPAIAAPPDGAELIDDQDVFWGLAKRLGVSLEYDGVPLDMETPPALDDLLALSARNSQMPYEDIRALEGGAIFDVPPQYVEAAEPDATDRFQLWPHDVAAEFAAMTAAPEPVDPDFPLQLVVRRMREVMNSLGHQLPSVRRRRPANLAQMHPDDLAVLGIASGDPVRIDSRHGHVETIAEADPTLRRGVMSLCHGWGGLPGDAQAVGVPINLLTSSERDVDPLNAMPRFSGLPVRVAGVTRSAFAQGRMTA